MGSVSKRSPKPAMRGRACLMAAWTDARVSEALWLSWVSQVSAFEQDGDEGVALARGRAHFSDQTVHAGCLFHRGVGDGCSGAGVGQRQGCQRPQHLAAGYGHACPRVELFLGSIGVSLGAAKHKPASWRIRCGSG
jgi:hypothetical protein